MTNIPVNPVLEMQIGGTWVDVTADCRLGDADSGGGFEVTRGVPNEGGTVEPTQLNFVLNNGPSKVTSTLGQSGVYSPRNPVGPYFGLLKRNQPIRLGVDRRIDTFGRSRTDGWGSLPDQARVDGGTDPGERWNLYGSAQFFDVNGSEALIAGATANKIATINRQYGDVDVKARMKVSNRTSEFGIVLRMKSFVKPAPAGVETSFTDSVAGWATLNCTIARDTVVFHTNGASLKATVTGSPTSASIATPTTIGSLWTGVTSGKSYTLRFRGRTSIVSNLQPALSFYDSAGVFITSLATNIATAANTWTLCELTVTAPQDAAYIRVGVVITGSPPAGTNFWVDEVEVQDASDMAWYSAYVTPGAPDLLQVGKVAPGGVIRSVNTFLATNVVANTWYWMRAQITGQRMRVKIWLDGDPEPGWMYRYFDDKTESEGQVPLYGEVGFISKDGTALMTIDSVQIDQWRAHAEIAELPPRWDLARVDRWVPIQARGITRRLGQGRKALRSAVSLHLQAYTASCYGWWPLEDDVGESAGNNIEGGLPAKVSGLEMGQTELTGVAALPGVSGYATLATDQAYIIGSVPNHSNPGKESFLFFFKIDATPTGSDALIATITASGTARTWRIWYQMDKGLRVEALTGGNDVIFSQVGAFYDIISEIPTGSWVAGNLYIFNSGGNVQWAFNFHKPGTETFWTLNGSFAGSIGRYTGISFRGSPGGTSAGGVSITQVMHYANDLPFVDYDFRRAAYAYRGETAGARANRLCSNAGISFTSMGFSGNTEAMGYQLPEKLLDLLGDCATVDGGYLVEERADFGLCLITKAGTWNRRKRTLDIDKGHMSAPLEPTDDDQATRNDITVRRTNGGFARAIQTSGPLNINPPESDVNGVGTYDDTPEVNFATDTQLPAAASFLRAAGTMDEARYPSFHIDLAATAYNTDQGMTATVLAMDAAEVIEVVNPEVSADPTEQQVRGYVEHLDQWDWDLTFNATPSRVRRVGTVNYTTRIDSESNKTTASFVAGTDVYMTTQNLGVGYPWVVLADSPDSFPFEIDAAGVRLKVLATGRILNSNIGFENGIVGWEPTDSLLVSVASDRYDPKRGTYCGRVQPVGSPAFPMTQGAITTVAARFPVLATTDYIACCWVKGEVALTDFRIAIDWYNAAGTFLSSTLPTSIVTTAGVWTWYYTTVTSPATAAFGRTRARNVWASNYRVWLDDVMFIPASTVTPDPQTLTVEQIPVNKVVKTIPSGTTVRVAAPWRVGW